MLGAARRSFPLHERPKRWHDERCIDHHYHVHNSARIGSVVIVQHAITHSGVVHTDFEKSISPHTDGIYTVHTVYGIIGRKGM